MSTGRVLKSVGVGLLLLSLIGLGSCGGKSADPTTTEGVTTTTEAPVDCAKATVEAGVGEAVSHLSCHGNWATVMTSAYVSKCTDCESLLLYEWSAGSWQLRANCSQYSPLIDESSCSAVSGSASKMDFLDKWVDFPPSGILCELWPANRFPENVGQTGCQPDTPPDQGNSDANPAPCVDYAYASTLPIAYCSEGLGVETAQGFLLNDGYKIDPDGYFGPGTLKALKKYQKKHSLAITGEIDEPTWRSFDPTQESMPGRDMNGDGLVTPDEFYAD